MAENSLCKRDEKYMESDGKYLIFGRENDFLRVMIQKFPKKANTTI
jgi:hypothetical protein